MKYGASLFFDRPDLIALIKRTLPRSVFNELHRTRTHLRVLRNIRGVFPRTCPICGYEGNFDAAGDPPRYDARCRHCGSYERNRLLKLWLDRENHGNRLGRVIHFAPEDAMIPMIRALSSDYNGADIRPGRADLTLNIESIELPDASVDTVVCFHVLEHVDDRKALAEFARILRPGGQALLMVPIVEGWAETYENAAVDSDAGRVLHFGQFDHIRFYGADLRQRIREAGFGLEEFVAREPDVAKFGLMRGETLFVARSPATPSSAS